MCDTNKTTYSCRHTHTIFTYCPHANLHFPPNSMGRLCHVLDKPRMTTTSKPCSNTGCEWYDWSFAHACPHACSHTCPHIQSHSHEHSHLHSYPHSHTYGHSHDYPYHHPHTPTHSHSHNHMRGEWRRWKWKWQCCHCGLRNEPAAMTCAGLGTKTLPGVGGTMTAVRGRCGHVMCGGCREVEVYVHSPPTGTR